MLCKQVSETQACTFKFYVFNPMYYCWYTLKTVGRTISKIRVLYLSYLAWLFSFDEMQFAYVLCLFVLLCTEICEIFPLAHSIAYILVVKSSAQDSQGDYSAQKWH